MGVAVEVILAAQGHTQPRHSRRNLQDAGHGRIRRAAVRQTRTVQGQPVSRDIFSRRKRFHQYGLRIAQTLVLLITTTETNVVGGAATYASIATSLFAPARIVAIVGSDFPEATLNELRLRRIDTEGVWRADGKTFRWSGRYSQNLGSRTTLATQLCLA